MSFLLHPLFLCPLFIEGVISLVVGTCFRRSFGLAVFWLLFPLVVSLAMFGQDLFANNSEARSAAELFCIVLSLAGFVVCGLGLLLGSPFRWLLGLPSASHPNT